MMADGYGREGLNPSAVPLAEFLQEERTRRGLTLERFAAEIQEAGWREARHHSQCSKQLVWCWCRGSVTPGPEHRWMIAKFLQIPVGVITAMAQEQKRNVRQLRQRRASIMQDSDVDRRTFLRLSLAVGGGAITGGLANSDLSRLLYGYIDHDHESVALDDLDSRVLQAWNLWLNKPDRFTIVAALLPRLANDVDHATRQYKTPQDRLARRHAHSIAAHHYFLLRSFFRAAGRYDLATQAADRGIVAAENADNPVLIAAGKWNLATVLLIDGHPALAEEVALNAARTIAPRMNDDNQARAIYGALHLTAASAAVRNHGDLASARNHIWSKAEPIARHTGEVEIWTSFGPDNLYVIATGVEMKARNSTEALRLADKVDTSKIGSVERSGTHFLELASCYDQRAEDTGVLHYLLRAESVMSEDIRYHALSKPLINSLVKRSRPCIRQEVQALAKRVGFQYYELP